MQDLRHGTGRPTAAASDSLLLPCLAATVAGLLLAELSLITTVRTDYSIEAQPAFDALRHGHVTQFIDLAPAYGGSMILRSPLALLPALWGGGALAVFRAVSLPAVAVLSVFAVLLWRAAINRGTSRRAAYGALVLVVANPLAWAALRTGHSEEILVAVACVAAAVAAGHRRTTLAAVLFGCAVASKPWAIVALGPLLVVLDTGRVRFIAIATGVAGLILAPILLRGGQSLTATASVAHSTGDLANPWQVWWFLGDHAGPVHRTLGRVFHDYRTEPHWVTQVSHPLVVAVPFVLCLARYRVLRARPWHHVLLVLAAVFMARCLLDTWNHHYYALPAVLALATWEVVGRARAPFAALGLTLFTLASIVILPGLATADVEAVVYLLWAVPFTTALLTAAFAPRQWVLFTRRVAAMRSTGVSGVQRSAGGAPAHVG
jgi:Glycosyltransferase family 87